ncbi:MAG: crossover junction endodeoxyribonuclease RuvC [Balneolaceae bacterium]
MSHKILGIDPGSRHTGYALLVEKNGALKVELCDVLHLSNEDDHTRRLQTIFSEITALVKKFQPTSCAVETPIYGVDPLAMLKLGRAQAAAILAITNHGIPVAEYYPKKVKKSITGNGNASKKQVAYMLDKIIGIKTESLPADATDALAVAWCHNMYLHSATGTADPKKNHQNNRKSSWSAFVADNPERIKGR